MVCYTSVSIATFLTDVNMDIAVKYKIAWNKVFSVSD